MTVGGRPLKASRESPAPMSATSSSLTIFTTCWAGVRLSMTSAPRARSFTWLTNSRTTLKLTSASSSARRISRMALSTSASLSLPWPRRLAEDALQALGEGIEHAGRPLSLRTVGRYPQAPDSTAPRGATRSRHALRRRRAAVPYGDARVGATGGAAGRPRRARARGSCRAAGRPPRSAGCRRR